MASGPSERSAPRRARARAAGRRGAGTARPARGCCSVGEGEVGPAADRPDPRRAGPRARRRPGSTPVSVGDATASGATVYTTSPGSRVARGTWSGGAASGTQRQHRIDQLADRLEHVLAVVEDDELLAIAEHLDERVLERAVLAVLHIEGRRDRGGTASGSRTAASSTMTRSDRPNLPYVGGDPTGEAGLADAARARPGVTSARSATSAASWSQVVVAARPDVFGSSNVARHGRGRGRRGPRRGPPAERRVVRDGSVPRAREPRSTSSRPKSSRSRRARVVRRAAAPRPGGPSGTAPASAGSQNAPATGRGDRRSRSPTTLDGRRRARAGRRSSAR